MLTNCQASSLVVSVEIIMFQKPFVAMMILPRTLGLSYWLIWPELLVIHTLIIAYSTWKQGRKIPGFLLGSGFGSWYLVFLSFWEGFGSWFSEFLGAKGPSTNRSCE
jgi:hypothetical protein